eukprot:m.24073 g.24073  ORF g.24073 m.24073 type:complete len:402 (-) comp14470_c0_seq1:294-1499(-)
MRSASILVAFAGTFAVALSTPVRDTISVENQYVSHMRSVLEGLPPQTANFSVQPSPRRKPVFKHGADCEGSPSTSNPSTIHQLRPGDIKVVGAIGDSVTAGFGELSRTVLDLLNEYRGSSWCMGGEGDADSLTSVPNLLKLFGSPAIGQSKGQNVAGFPNAGAGLNIAISGAIAQGMAAQAVDLIKKMKETREINYEEDWKVITLWIGGNDLCAVCNDNERNQPYAYTQYIEEALDILQRDVPRAFVNLVSILDIVELAEVNAGFCSLINRNVCPCGTSEDPEVLARVSRDGREMQLLTAELAAKSKYHSSNDFTVELQPFFTESKVPRGPDGKPDLEFFAPDCFHFSKMGHEAIATGLWNNMLQAPSKKSLAFVVGEPLECPTADAPFLCTLTNNCGSRS